MEELNLYSIQSIHSLFKVPSAHRTTYHLEQIMHFIKDNKFLNKICKEHNSDRILWECCRVLTLEIHERNSVIISFGEIADRFYIILKGTVNVILPTQVIRRTNSSKQDLFQSIKRMNSLGQDDSQEFNLTEEEEKFSSYIKAIQVEKPELDFDYLNNFGLIQEGKGVRVLKEGDCFGELALINNKPRGASVTAGSLVYLAVLSKKDFSKILAFHAFKALDERVKYLKGLPGFSLASKLSLQKLAYTFTEKIYRKDQMVYNNNDFVDTLYFVKTGEFKISQCDFIEKAKYSSSDVGVKLGMMKKLNKKVNIREVIKGKNEVFGYEELVEDKKKRIRRSTCASNISMIYEVKIEDLKLFPYYLDIFRFFEERHKNDYSRHFLLPNPMTEIHIKPRDNKESEA